MFCFFFQSNNRIWFLINSLVLEFLLIEYVLLEVQGIGPVDILFFLTNLVTTDINKAAWNVADVIRDSSYMYIHTTVASVIKRIKIQVRMYPVLILIYVLVWWTRTFNTKEFSALITILYMYTFITCKICPLILNI